MIRFEFKKFSLLENTDASRILTKNMENGHVILMSKSIPSKVHLLGQLHILVSYVVGYTLLKTVGSYIKALHHNLALQLLVHTNYRQLE